jgi:hypothetical protein
MQNFGSTSHRISHLYSNVGDLDNSSADELNDDEDLDDHWLHIGRPHPERLNPISTLNERLPEVIISRIRSTQLISPYAGMDFPTRKTTIITFVLWSERLAKWTCP